MNEAKRLAYFLPNVFTALNMACGFVAILFAFNGRIYHACMLLLLGAIFDSVDGRIARLTGTQSSFGEQFDSLSDAISFGIAPALIFYFRFFTGLNRVGIILCLIYLLCGALRLARFNANIDKVDSNYFQGLPIPMAAVGSIGLILVSLEIELIKSFRFIPGIVFLFYALLMISNIPFFSFKSSQWVKTHKKLALLIILCLLALLFLYEEIILSILIFLYVVISVGYFLANKGKFEDIFKFQDEREIEATD